jgi:hypothetical protein
MRVSEGVKMKILFLLIEVTWTLLPLVLPTEPNTMVSIFCTHGPISSFNEIELCAQNLLTILGSIITAIGRTYVIN